MMVQTLAEERLKRGHEVSVISLAKIRKCSVDTVNEVTAHRIVTDDLYYLFSGSKDMLKRFLWHLKDCYIDDPGEQIPMRDRGNVGRTRHGPNRQADGFLSSLD